MRRNLIFISEVGAETWVKGQIWAANFVPRVDWEAKDPVDVENFALPAQVGAIGHHTSGNRNCYTLEECIAVVQGVQDFHMGPERTDAKI